MFRKILWFCLHSSNHNHEMTVILSTAEQLKAKRDQVGLEKGQGGKICCTKPVCR